MPSQNSTHQSQNCLLSTTCISTKPEHFPFYDKNGEKHFPFSDKLPADLGYIYENVIAQMLKSAGNELFYYTFKEEVRNYGIDFLISRKDKDVICLPVYMADLL